MNLTLQHFLITLLNMEVNEPIRVDYKGTTYDICDIVYSTKEGISIICTEENDDVFTLGKLINTLHYLSLSKPINVKIDNKPYHIDAVSRRTGNKLFLEIVDM